VVDATGALALPWLAAPLRELLQRQQAHSLLLHGPQGVGQFELAIALAQGWLCEAESSDARPCGRCASCKLVQARSHPDLLVLVPEAMQSQLGWGANDDDAPTDRAAKGKPSQEIKVDAVRRAVAFAQITSGRGRGKVVVMHPAERMNGIAANTLLKTLEEPPGSARFVLSSAAPDALLPTIRSRCQAVAMTPPAAADAMAWLAAQGVADAAVLLAATGQQPQEALVWSQEGVDAASWSRLPALVAQGGAETLAGWPLPRVIDALQKLCHDSACVAAGAAPRYFPATAIARGADLAALNAWRAELTRVARNAEHPWNAPLLIESLVQQGRQALARTGLARRGVSVHSRP